MIIDELIAILGYDVKGEGELRRFNDGLDRAQRRAEVVANRINKMSVAVGTFLGNIASQVGTRLGSAIGSFPGDVIEVGKTFEALEIRLNTLEGSSDKAEKAMAWIRQFAKDTPLELAQVADAYADLKNFGLDPTNGSLQALTDAMSASGKGTAMLGRLTLAIGQAWVKQKLQGQEILQLTEAGIPVWDMLAEATGKNVQELQKLSSAGKLGRNEIQLLIDAIQNKYVGASEKFAKSFEGITSKLSDEWTEFLALIGEKGFYDDAKRRLEGVFDTIRKWDKEGLLDKAATSISNFLTGTVQTGAHIGSQLWTIGKGAVFAADGLTTLISRVTGLDKTVSTGVLGAAVIGSTATGRAAMLAIAKRVPWIAALLAIDDIMTAAKGGDSMIGQWTGQERIDKISASVRQLVDNLRTWAEFTVPENNSVIAAMDSQTTAAQKLADAFQKMIDGLNRLLGADQPDHVAQPTKPEIYGSDDAFDTNRLGPGQGGWIRDKPRPDTSGQMTDDALDRKFQLQQEEAERVAPRPKTRPLIDIAPSNGGQSSFNTFLGGMENALAAIKEQIATQGGDQIRAVVDNMNANLAKMVPENAVNATVTDARQDNRQFPVSTSVTVNQTVQQATQAPAAAAQATGNAVGQAVSQRANRVEISPAF